MYSSDAYFVIDGGFFLQVSMGGHPLRYRHPTSHPAIQRIATLNPLATHCEFTKLSPPLYASSNPRIQFGVPLYVFSRALRQNGPLINDDFDEVPLHVKGGARG